MLKVDWKSFGQCIRAHAISQAKAIDAARLPLGISHARMVNAAQGKPVGTEIFLTLCRWMDIDPFDFTAATHPSAFGD